MAINRRLAKQRNLDEETIQEIEDIHKRIDKLMKPPYINVHSVYLLIEEMEYRLQELWGFTRDAGHHRYKHEYKFKSSVVGKKIHNERTGETIVIPEDVRRGQLFTFKDGSFIDIGDGEYFRVNGVNFSRVKIS